MGEPMARVLVTGGLGFIGSAFIRQLASGDEVVNLDALTYAAQPGALEGLSDARYQFVKGDIADEALVARLLHDFRPDVLVNFAAESHVDRSISGPSAFAHTNIQGTLNLLECCRAWLGQEGEHGFRFLQVSTDEVYGDLGQAGRPAVEGDAWRPSSPYAASKAAADHLADAWHRTYGFPVMVSHCTNNYGPWQHPEKLIPLVIQRGLRHEPIPVYGSGNQVRDWIHVDDHVRALMCLVTKGRLGEHYNIGARQPVRNLDLVRMICSLLDQLCAENCPAGGHETLITHVEDRKGHDWRYELHGEKITALGWRPQVPLADGLRETVRFYVGRFGDG